MINIKPEIVQALESNQALISLLGGSRIYHLMAPNSDEFPRITFFELTNFVSDFADDGSYGSEIYVQIDIWMKVSSPQIAIEVDKSMKQINWQRTGSADLYEVDTRVHHKALRYRTRKMEV